MSRVNRVDSINAFSASLNCSHSTGCNELVAVTFQRRVHSFFMVHPAHATVVDSLM